MGHGITPGGGRGIRWDTLHPGDGSRDTAAGARVTAPMLVVESPITPVRWIARIGGTCRRRPHALENYLSGAHPSRSSRPPRKPRPPMNARSLVLLAPLAIAGLTEPAAAQSYDALSDDVRAFVA